MRSSRAGLLAGFLAIAVCAPARAQLARPAESAPPKVAHAARVAGAAPRIDGRLDDAAWAAAVPIADFIAKEPIEGAEPLERTEVRILYDDEFLYVGARMYADHPAAIQRSVARRDVSPGSSEHIWVSFDTYRDRRTAYSFGVTAAGERFDWYHPTDNETHIDMSYDPVWDGAASIDSLGWVAEMRIPFSQLRFTAADEQVWGFNIDRWVPSRFEDDFWIPVPKSVQAWSSRMGELVGIRGIRPSRRVELLPYAASNATVASAADAANPFNPHGREGEVRVGADLKMGLGPNMTLQAAVNPDFGQVEADPAVVNLSQFEVFFDERRPFFTEGSQLLRGNGPSYFYSRRIGASPSGPAEGDYVHRPSSSTILGAAKLTGRTAGGMSIGGLTAVTSRETARTFDIASGQYGRTVIAAPSFYSVARVQQEFGASRSVIGAMVTGVARDLGGTGLDSLLTRGAVTGGVDWNLRWQGGTYELGGFLGMSHVTGDRAVIQRLQTSPRRYFQRPDQHYVRVDSNLTVMNGFTAGLSLGKNNGRHWLWGIGSSLESPGLELNDAGRISTADGINLEGELEYRETVPGKRFRSYRIAVSAGNEWNYGGVRQEGITRSDVRLTFLNQMSLSLTGWIDLRARDERLTRGGPYMGTPSGWVTITQLQSNFAARTTWSARLYYGRDEFGGLTYRISGSLTTRPATRWLLSVNPNYLFARDTRQYVDAIADAAAAATYGTRYVFATVDDNEWGVPLRFNYAFTPDLTLELYAQPFIASGRFYRFGELERPGGSTLRVYGEAAGTRDSVGADGTHYVRDGAGSFTLEPQDFAFASLRSNLVLRWEWRRGSTLYLVWQQSRSGDGVAGARVRVGDVFDGLSAAGDNFFAVKVNYWLSGH